MYLKVTVCKYFTCLLCVYKGNNLHVSKDVYLWSTKETCELFPNHFSDHITYPIFHINLGSILPLEYYSNTSLPQISPLPDVPKVLQSHGKSKFHVFWSPRAPGYPHRPVGTPQLNKPTLGGLHSPINIPAPAKTHPSIPNCSPRPIYV